MDEITKRLDELEAAVRELKWTLTQLLEKAPKIKFVPPSHDECNAFAAEIGMTMDEATAFMLHYESNGWKVGPNPMKKWKAAMRSWHNRNQLNGHYNSKQGNGVAAQRNSGIIGSGDILAAIAADQHANRPPF